jgi:transposase-like protein
MREELTMPNHTAYTDEIAEQIIDRLWDGVPLTEICRDLELKPRTVRDWTQTHPEFGAQYKDAMVGGAHALVDETKEIVDNTDEKPESRKVRAWQRFEMAKRKAPHVFGDRVTLAGDRDNPLHGMSDADLDKAIAEKLAALQGGG